jgi:hypothetical protein
MRTATYNFKFNITKDASMQSAKKSARELIDQLPESVSWNKLMYELYVKQKVEQGLKELDDGLGIPHESVERAVLGDKAN